MTPTNVVPNRQLDPAISSLANPTMAMRLMDTDNPDHSSSNDRETDNWPVEYKMESLMEVVLMDHDDELAMDEYMLEHYSTGSDLDEEEEQVQDEQQQQPQQQQQQPPQQQQQEDEQQPNFIMPKTALSKNKKFKDLPPRRQKGRACKSTSKSYSEDFSDDADI